MSKKNTTSGQCTTCEADNERQQIAEALRRWGVMVPPPHPDDKAMIRSEVLDPPPAPKPKKPGLYTKGI